jgi:hypothetical protein
MYFMALKVYTCAKAASGLKNFFQHVFSNFCKEMNISQFNFGPNSNIDSQLSSAYLKVLKENFKDMQYTRKVIILLSSNAMIKFTSKHYVTMNSHTFAWRNVSSKLQQD